MTVKKSITPDDIEANIAFEHYFTAMDGVTESEAKQTAIGRRLILEGLSARSLPLLTFCVLVLRNGFTVTGESACAHPEIFDAEIGRKLARENAVAKVWPLMGYELKTTLAKEV
jgi:hypothetical protein